LKYYIERASITTKGSFTWEYLEVTGDRPSCRMCHTACAEIHGSKIYYIGGQHGQTNRFDGVYSFDVTTNKFTNFTNFKSTTKPPKFARHTTVNIDNKLYSFGGYDGIGTYFGLAVFDPATVTWAYPTTYGETPILRTNHAAAAIGSKMYIYGGNRTDEDKTYHIYGDLCVFDTKTMTWSKPITSGDVPGPRVAHKLLAVGNKLYLFGGGLWTPEKDWIEKNTIHSRV
jgi:N-acetylneuraminic acid mutarotase